MSSATSPLARRPSLPVAAPRRSRRSLRPAAIEGLVVGDDVNREFFELMSTSAPRRSTVGRALRGLVGAEGLDAARPHLDVLLRAAQAHSLREHPADAASALVHLGRMARAARDRGVADAYTCAARQLAAAEAVEALLDAATQPSADLPSLCDALAFAGAEAVVDGVMRRLNGAQDLSTRRAYYDLALALGARAEMRRWLEIRLTLSLGDQRWFVVRNALVLLAALRIAVPRDSAQALAVSAHRQVRLALAQVTARLAPSAETLDILIGLLGDEDAGVRFAAGVGLGRNGHPKARQALRHAVAAETDPETKSAMALALSRRSRAAQRAA